MNNTIEMQKAAVGLALIIVIMLAIAILIIRIKDRRILNKNIQDKTIKQNSKFGGILSFFWVICFYQIIVRLFDTANAERLGQSLEFYKNTIIVQNTFMIILACYQICITLKRKEQTPKKLIKSHIVMLIVNTMITLTRIIYAYMNPSQYYTKEYFIQEANILISNITYPLVWIIYFKISKRVQIYYYLPQKKLKEILKETKIYQYIKRKKTNETKAKNN